MRALVEEMTTFAVVVDSGSFTAAAKQLNRSKTYVSLQISKLEKAIGLQLLFRTTRRLELTEAGRAYLDYCRQLLQAADQAAQTVEALKGEMRGTIRLSVPVSFGQVFLMEIVSAFQQLYPEIRFDLELHNALRDLKAEGLDMAIRISSELPDDMVAIRIGELQTRIYGTPEYLQRRGIPENPADLSDHEVILQSRVDSDGCWPFQEGKELSRIPVPWKMAVNNYPLIREAALENKGLARLPSYLVQRDLALGTLVEVLAAFKSLSQPIYLVYDYQGVLPLKNRRFIDFVKDWFGSTAPPD